MNVTSGSDIYSYFVRSCARRMRQLPVNFKVHLESYGITLNVGVFFRSWTAMITVTNRYVNITYLHELK